MSVTYTFGDTMEVVDNTKIISWLKVKKSQVTVNEEKVKEYVSELASKYDTNYIKRTFQTHDGNTVEIDGNEYVQIFKVKCRYKENLSMQKAD